METHRAKVVASVALLLLGIACVLLLTVPVQDVLEPPKYMYGIVIDAGSSHTSMFIYKWPSDKQNGTGVVTQHAECHVKGGGISSYAGQQGAAAGSLEKCLQQAERDIPRARHHLTPVYLGATAGMRLLNISSPQASALVLQEVGQKIKSHPFSFQGANILSGQEEGVYGWVTVNYLLGNLIKYGFVGRWVSADRQTVGALDLGGASTQITFVTQQAVVDERNRVALRLYGQDYTLYTHSYLCYGRQEVLRRLLALLITSQGSTGQVYHPCYPVGYSVSIRMGQVFESPCVGAQMPAPYQPQARLTVVGTGLYRPCLGNVSLLFAFDSCASSQCSFNGVVQPELSGSFMAFSAFYFTHRFLQRATRTSISSPAQLELATQTACSMSYDALLQQVPEQSLYVHDDCSVAVFTSLLLLRGYRFDQHSLPHVTFQKKADGASVGWALGYMLSVSSLLPEEQADLRKALIPAAWVGMLVLLSLLLTFALTSALGFGLLVRRKRNANSDC